MRLVEKHPKAPTLDASPEARAVLTAWFDREIEDAISARSAQESIWRENLRLYEGVPRNPVRNVPVENAPNIEVTLGAIATDAIYAMALDLIFSIAPVLSVRAIQGDRTASAKALQRFVNWGISNEWALRSEADNMILDDVQLGTGVLYTPFVEHRKKTKVAKVTSRGPRIFSIAPEDFIVPGGAKGDLQIERWIAVRWWLTAGELEERAKAKGWDTEGVVPVGTVGWTRSQRERLGRTTTGSTQISELYEIYEVYGYYDIDGDDIQEDLLWAWDRGSRRLLSVNYNPYDYRPFDAARYQIRSHLFYGLSVMDMIRPYQEEMSEIHNFSTLNMLLANARMWKAKDGSVPETMKVWPGKVNFMQNPDDLQGEAMADVYPSATIAQQMVTSLAERRVGINELSMPRPSAIMGSRTPGITALSMLQQTNRRFTPAFEGIRIAIAGAVRQCLYRYQERLLGKDAKLEDHVRKVLGTDDGNLVLELLMDPEFDEAIAVELTAASVSVNREADRQNALLLVNVLAQYYQRTLELVTIASNPQTPEEVRSVARKIATSAGEIIDRTIRTFDQIRDPELFIVQIDEELNQIGNLSQQGMLGLSNIFNQIAMSAGRGGLNPSEAVNGAPVA